jgi:hypothetical protein
MRLFAEAVAALLVLAPAPAQASDDADLIPSDVLDTAPPPPASVSPPKPATPRPSPWRTKLFAEDALSFWSPAGAVPVPYPSSLVSSWQNRTSLDLALEWRARPRLTLTLSDRLNVFIEDAHAVASPNTVRNDLREASLTWEPLDGYYFEAGRINVRNGVALGYNPTDFFKTRTLVGQSSLDPSVIRQNRLGTLLVREQTLWAWGSSSISYAPKVSDPAPVTPKDPLGVDPHFDATNAAHRVLCTLSFEVLDLSPQLLGYFELHRPKLGANVSHPIGDAVVAYAEWAAGPEADLSARAAAFGRQTGTLPRSFPTTPQADGTDALRNDLAAGFSWTVATAVTFNAEYHFHQAGFTHRDWDHWFDIGSAPGAPPALTGALWFVRAYALDQQEPVSQQQLFVRASWPQAFTPDLELSGFAFISLLDGSVLSQLSASYYVSNVWTASAFVAGNFGDRRTERGSVPQRGNAILQLTRYF